MEQQHNRGFWQETEQEFRKAGDVTMVDFFKELLPNEYELEQVRHQQEWQNIEQKIKYRFTIEGKKQVLNDELEQTIAYLEDEEEGEFRQVFGDLSQVTLDRVIDKIKSTAFLIQKTSLWNELGHNEKRFFLAIKNLRSNLISADLPFTQAYREILRRLNIRLLTEKDKKIKPTTINRQLKEFVNRLFYDHFQVELNKLLQKELKQYFEVSDYQLADIVEESKNSSDRKISAVLPKVKRSANDGITTLALDQTTYLFSLLREQGIILKEKNYQSASNIALAIKILTGYNEQNVREKLDKNDSIDRMDKFVVQEKLKKVNVLIVNELK